MTKKDKLRGKMIRLYWTTAKENCPFHDKDLQNGYYEGFIDGAGKATKDCVDRSVNIINELLGHCRALKAITHQDIPKLNINIKIAENYLLEMKK